jgi:hypothetical protein
LGYLKLAFDFRDGREQEVFGKCGRSPAFAANPTNAVDWILATADAF